MFLLKIYVFVSRFYCFKRFHSIFITLTEQHCLYQTAGLLQADSITHCPGLLANFDLRTSLDLMTHFTRRSL